MARSTVNSNSSRRRFASLALNLILLSRVCVDLFSFSLIWLFFLFTTVSFLKLTLNFLWRILHSLVVGDGDGKLDGVMLGIGEGDIFVKHMFVWRIWESFSPLSSRATSSARKVSSLACKMALSIGESALEMRRTNLRIFRFNARKGSVNSSVLLLSKLSHRCLSSKQWGDGVIGWTGVTLGEGRTVPLGVGVGVGVPEGRGSLLGPGGIGMACRIVK